jgi:hypothetical protein
VAGKYSATDTGQARSTSGGHARNHGGRATQAEQQAREGQPGADHGGRTAADEIKAIKIYYTNSRSLVSKIDELRATATDQQPDIILICETWTNPDISNAELTIDGYCIETDLRKDREDTQHGIGGGLLIFTKSGLKIRKNDKYNNNNFSQFTSFIVLSKKPVEITLIYRPPNSGTANMEALCSLIDNASREAIFIGDFNVPEIDWKNERSGSRARSLMETIKRAEMVQLVDFKTHNRGNILDLVLTNCSERILNVEEAGKLGNSDHCAIQIEVAVHVETKKKSINRPDWKKADFEAIRNSLDRTHWDENLNGTVEADWLFLKEKLQECVERFVPNIKIYVSQRPKWLSQEIIRLIRRKKAAWKEYRLYGTAELHERYTGLEREVKSKIKKAKRRMERELTKGDDRNGKKFANYIKSKTKSRTPIGPLKDDQGNIITDERKMAKILNDYFSSVYSKEDKNNMPTKERETQVSLENITITSELVEKKIQSLRKDSAPGPDNIHPHLMRETKRQISVPLSKIFRKSIDTGQVPKDWKIARVTPIFKKGIKSLASNYRPVSLTSVPCKILEGLIKDEMMEHLLTNKLINNSQHGFIPGRSCASNLTIFLDTVTKLIDEGSSADIFYLDFAKAFDKVPHERLLVKLEAKGITGKVKEWIREWLRDRSQCVILGEQKSEHSSVDSGMSQGTILGPPLFTVHIDDIDLEMLLADLAVKFADDTKGVKKIASLEDRENLQAVFDKLYGWSQKWGMEFNVAKCKIMHVGQNNPKHKYYINGQELCTVEEEKDIGVLVHNSLKPAKHCEKAANMAGAVLRQIQRNFHYRDRKVFVNLYKTYVLPHLEFASPAWAPWTVADTERLENVQKKAVRMVTGLASNTYEDRCREIGIKTLAERRRITDLVLVHGFINGRGGMSIDGLFEKLEEREGARTRQAAGTNNLKTKQARTEVRKNSFTVRVVKEWNGLPEELKKCTDRNRFKRALKNHFGNGGRF